MIKIKSKTRVILGIFLILYSLIQSYRGLTLWFDVEASVIKAGLNKSGISHMTEHDLSGADALSTADPMTLIDGIMPPSASDTYSQMYSLASDNRKKSDAFFAADEDIEAWLANVPDLDARTRAICDRLPQLLASFPVAAPERPDKKCYAGAISIFEPVKDSARFCALLAWRAAQHGNQQQALLLACAPAAIGALFEIRETQTGALSGLGFETGETKGKLTGSLLRELAPMLKCSREDVLQLLNWVETLENAFLPPARMVANEINYWPEFARRWQQAIVSGEAMKAVGRNPHALVGLFKDQAVIDSYLVPVMSSYRQVCAEPYPQAVKRLAEVHELAYPLKQFKASISLNYIKFFFLPETSFLQRLLGMMPDLEKNYIYWITTKAKLRGGALAVALHAYYNENGSWPADMAAVAAWLGVPSLPQDPFTAAAWNYNASGPSLLSSGPDLQTGTPDDLQFLKVSH